MEERLPFPVFRLPRSAMTPSAFAPWLTTALAAALDLRPAEVPPAPAAVAAADDGLLPTLAALERWRPGLLPPEVATRAAAAAPTARDGTAALLAAVEALAPGISERRVDWAALGGLDLLLRLELAPGWRGLPRAEALAAPFEVGRARLVTAARGLGGGAGTRARLDFVTRLAPRGWSSLPFGPFLEDAAPLEGSGIPLMTPGAAWAAHLVRIGRGLFEPGSAGALELAEAALRGLLVDPDERVDWDERLPRWRARRLWRRARAVEAWLLGGARPEDLAPNLGDPGARGVTTGVRRLRAGLKLQDGPVAALRYLALTLGRRRHAAE